MNNYHYNKRLKAFARKLRNNPTRAEEILWYELLSNAQFGGYKFLRQRPIYKYIADFFCKELKLLIEVDGISHDCPIQYEKDCLRDSELLKLGYQTLRFSNWEVINDLGLVQEILWKKIQEIKNGTC